MAELTIPRAHSDNWYDQLALAQRGYYYPWQSSIADGNGNESFVDLVKAHLGPDKSVLEVACGHGALALEIAPHCKHVTAYDRVPAYIDLAEDNLSRSDIRNVRYVCHNALDPTHESVTLPVADASVDVIVCQLGPLHWIDDALRVCRPGATLIALNPMEEPIPAWTDKLPHKLHYENSGRHTGTGSIHQSVENRLHRAGLTLHSGWSFDVPEVFDDPRELYKVVTWGLPPAETPAFEDIEHRFKQIWDTYAVAGGVELRHCRFLWKAVLTA